ncbi:MAG: 4-alpha-glucanotransferase [Enterocloster bolteae]
MGTPDIKEIITMRECGMLLPVASLPSRYGIGAFSKEAYDFIDTLKAAGQSFVADSASGPHGIRRFAIPVLFGLCGKSLFY